VAAGWRFCFSKDVGECGSVASNRETKLARGWTLKVGACLLANWELRVGACRSEEAKRIEAEVGNERVKLAGRDGGDWKSAECCKFGAKN